MGFLEQDEKKTMANSMFIVGRAVRKDVDPGRLSSMPDSEFEREVDGLSNEILEEIGVLKKRYYEEGFREALKQVRQGQDNYRAGFKEAERQGDEQVDSTLVVSSQQLSRQAAVDLAQFDSKFSSIYGKLSEFSDRIAAVEQTLLSSPSRDEELREIIAENRDLVGTLKSKVSEIAVLQSSIEEKLSQVQTQSMPSSELYEKIESMKTQIDNLGNLIVEEGGKVNAFEKARKSSVRRLDRKLNSLAKKLVDFKKVRKQIRKQGKRITSLSKGMVAKTSFKTAIKRVSAKTTRVAAKPRRRAVNSNTRVSIAVSGVKATRSGKARKLAPKKTVRKAKAKGAKQAENSKISISAPARSTVEITQKK